MEKTYWKPNWRENLMFWWNWQLKRWVEHIGLHIEMLITCTYKSKQKKNLKFQNQNRGDGEKPNCRIYTKAGDMKNWHIIHLHIRQIQISQQPLIPIYNRKAALHSMMSVIHQNKMKISSTSTDHDDNVYADDTMTPTWSLMLTKFDKIQVKSIDLQQLNIDWGTVTVCTRLHCPIITIKIEMKHSPNGNIENVAANWAWHSHIAKSLSRHNHRCD